MPGIDFTAIFQLIFIFFRFGLLRKTDTSTVLARPAFECFTFPKKQCFVVPDMLSQFHNSRNFTYSFSINLCRDKKYMWCLLTDHILRNLSVRHRSVLFYHKACFVYLGNPFHRSTRPSTVNSSEKNPGNTSRWFVNPFACERSPASVLHLIAEFIRITDNYRLRSAPIFIPLK